MDKEPDTTNELDEILDNYNDLLKDFVFWKVQANVQRGADRDTTKQAIQALITKEKNKLLIEIAPLNIPRSRVNRFKTWFWNKILPPQIRLHLPEED